MSVDIQDVITCATFCDDRLRGLGVARGRISRFPIDLRRRPYNTLALPRECVILVIRLSRSLLHTERTGCAPEVKVYVCVIDMNYNYTNNSYWLLRIRLLPAAWADQQYIA